MTTTTLVSIALGIVLLVIAGMTIWIVFWARNGSRMRSIEWLPMLLLFAAGAVFNIAMVSFALGWDRIRGKPTPAPEN